MQYGFLKELILRLKSENPTWFKILMWAGITVFGLALCTRWLIAEEILEFTNNPALGVKIKKIALAIIGFGAGTFFTSITATTKADLQDDKTVKNLMQERL